MYTESIMFEASSFVVHTCLTSHLNVYKQSTHINRQQQFSAQNNLLTIHINKVP